MPSPNATPTPITPPRVPLIDTRTGLIDRAWYLFFLSLNNIATAVVDDVNLATDSASLIASYDAALRALAQEVETLPPVVTLPVPDVLGDCCSALESQMAEMQKQIEALQVQPIVDVGAISASIAALSSAPVTKTADFTVAANETWLINNKSGSTCTVTLPSASLYVGRYLTFKNLQAQTLVSASSNVVLIDGTSAGTAILLAVVGNWATMVSDGTNWIIMQQAANNCLLLE
jgi:hypothetical protein